MGHSGQDLTILAEVLDRVEIYYQVWRSYVNSLCKINRESKLF